MRRGQTPGRSSILRTGGLVIPFLCLLAALQGCKREGPAAPTDEPSAIAKEYKRGPIIFRLKVSDKEISIADRIRLVVEVLLKEEYEAELPGFGEKLEQFGIVDYRSSPPELADDGMVLSRKSYELEPFLSGEYKIPPMKVVFWKKGEEDKKHELESEELTIKVKSLLPEDTAELAIKEIAPPVELPRPSRRWLYLSIAGGVFLVGVVAAVVLWCKRRAIVEAIIRCPAHEVAYDQLEALLAEDLVKEGLVKPFYLRLSHILRHYIENRFGLHAPERTTEEFLAELRSADVLPAAHKDLLREFLEHCDLVKFAEHDPTNDQIQRTFDTCKRFIAETQVEEKTVEATPADAL